jgi:ABC-2 type transport system permease protein
MTVLLDWHPAAGVAPRAQMLRAQAGIELRLTLRNLEQVGLTLVLPLLLTVVLNLPGLYSLDGRRIDFVVPSVIALCVLSASFTGLAIGTGFERKYGVLKRLGATALPRSILIGGKLSAVLMLEAIQLRWWAPSGSCWAGTRTATRCWPWCWSCSARPRSPDSGCLLAGTLPCGGTSRSRPANLLWFVLLFSGGIAIPLQPGSPTASPASCD